MGDIGEPVMTLTTDFGLRDGHVGAMKGVIHSIAPAARLIDISHDIPPQDIQHGGFVVMTAYAFWPSNTVHLIVIDPGVGSERRAVAVETSQGTFVAPDNGVLSHVLARERVLHAVSLTNPRFWHHPVSPVFHGRDIFGPAAAHIVTGIDLMALGQPLVEEELTRIPVPMPERHTDGRITAHIQHIDTFGNCTTDLPGDWVRARNHWQVAVGGYVIDQIGRTFSDVPSGEVVALVDSTDFVAIAVRNGHAAETLGLEIGSVVTLSPKSALPGVPS